MDHAAGAGFRELFKQSKLPALGTPIAIGSATETLIEARDVELVQVLPLGPS
jgi:hypothetical protein